MMQTEKFVGESKINEQPKKRLVQVIKDKAIKPRHISDEVKNDIIQPLIDESLKDIQHQIDTFQRNGIAISNDFGNDSYIGISQKTLTKEFNLIWDLLLRKVFNINFTSDIPEVFVDEVTEIHLNVSLDIEVDRISIKDPLGNTIATTSNSNTLTCPYFAASDVEKTLTFEAEIAVGGGTKSITLDVPVKKAEITKFEIEPRVLEVGRTAYMNVLLETTKEANVQIVKEIGGVQEVLYNSNTNNVNLDFTLDNPQVGTIKFIAKVTKGSEVVTQEVLVSVVDVSIEIAEFSVDADYLYLGEERTLTFTGRTTTPGRLTIYDSNGNELQHLNEANSITYHHTLTPNQSGTIYFTLKAERGSNIVTRTVDITVGDRKYAYIGGGASYEDVMTNDNKWAEYGKGEVLDYVWYEFEANDGDYLWFIFPSSVRAAQIGSDVSVINTSAAIIEVGGIEYIAYKSRVRVNGGTKRVKVTFE